MELFKSRTRVAYTNAVGDKVYPVVVDIKKGIKSTEDIQFVSSDVNTGILSVAFIQGNDNYNVTGADVVCSVMRPDASTLELPCEVVGENIVEVPLGINGTSQDGVYSFDFKVFKGENKVVGTPIMNYSVSLSIGNDMVVEEDDRLPVLTVLMTQLTELKDEARESITQANTATVATKEATAKAIEATNNANAVSERVSQETSEVISRVDNKVNEVETRFNALTTSQQQDAEVIDARDGETSLKARLDRDIEKAKQVYVELEGNHISTESSTGAIQDLEIKGNTVQDPNNLADIKSVGELQEDGTYKMSILSCGKNLFNIKEPFNKTYSDNWGKEVVVTNGIVSTSGLAGIESSKSQSYKFKPNTNYTFSAEAMGCGFTVRIYNQSTRTNIREGTILTNKRSFITFNTSNIPSNDIRIVFHRLSDVPINTCGMFNIQIEEGTVATPYEPYQGNKCDILLPCQLEKVEDVSDRLFRREDGVWGVEKNIKTIRLGSESAWYAQTNKNGIKLFANRDYLSNGIRNRAILCDALTVNNGINQEVIDGYNQILAHKDANYSQNLYISKDFENTPLFTAWLDENPINIKYVTETEPQFIPLPRDTQIALNSFFGTTHVYMESGEVEGTIKCKIPKSLGATVQSLNNKTDILSDRIEAIEGLKDSQNMKYETDKGYLVCKETKNGVIDDLKIEGKTLVNLFDNLTSMGRGYTYDTLTKILKSHPSGIDDWSWGNIPSIFNIKADTEYTLVFNGITSNTFLAVRSYDEIEDVTVNPCVIGLNVIKFTSSGTNFKLKIYDANRSTQVSISHLMLLEGDHTQNPPSYFEGLMSVGQDVDKIEVLSSGEKQTFEIEHGSLETSTGREFDSSTNGRTGFIKCTMPYIDKNIACRVFEYRKDKSFIRTTSFDDLRHYVSDECYYIRIIAPYNELLKLKTRVQSDKKQILFYNSNGELEPIQELHEWDSIEKHSDNKWYYHKRSGKRSYQTEDENNSNYITDMTNTVYQLAEEEVYELAPLHLDSYANETLILCNSGAISPKMEFSITSHINELVKSQGDRISLLEEKMYKALKQVLAGDMYSLAELLYPEDFVEENPENEIMLLPFE